jgi:hypothetical protein
VTLFTPHHNEQSTATEIFQQEMRTSSDKNSIRFFFFHRQGGIVKVFISLFLFESSARPYHDMSFELKNVPKERVKLSLFLSHGQPFMSVLFLTTA